MNLVKSFKADPDLLKNLIILLAEVLLLSSLAYFHSASIPEEKRIRLDIFKAGDLNPIALQQPYPLRFEIKYRTEGKVPADSKFSIQVNDHIQTFPIEHSDELRKVWIDIPKSALKAGQNIFGYFLSNQPERLVLDRMRFTNYYYLLTPKFPLALVLYDEQLGDKRQGGFFRHVIELIMILVWSGFLIFLVFLVMEVCFKNNLLSTIVWVKNYCAFAIFVFLSATAFSVFTDYHIAFSSDTLKWILCVLPLLVYVTGTIFSSRSFGLGGEGAVMDGASGQASRLEKIVQGRYGLLLLMWGIFTLPLSFKEPCIGIDCSYETGMFLSATSGFQHGKDIVFTYGPTLPYLFKEAYYFNWDFWIANNLGLLFAHFMFVGAIACVLLTSRASFSSGLFLIAVASIEEFLISEKLVLAGGILWFCVLIRKIRSPWRLPAIALSTSALAFATFSKLTMGVAGLSFILVFLLISVFKKNRDLLVEGLAGVLFYIFFILFFWRMTGQELQFFADYIQNSLQIIGGYSEARAAPGSRSSLLLCLMGLVGAVVVFVHAVRRRDQAIILFSLVFSGYLVVLFKSVFTSPRYPGEFMSAFLVLVGLYFVLIKDGKSVEDRKLIWIQKGLTVIVLMFALSMGRNGFLHHTLLTSWEPFNIFVELVQEPSAQKRTEEELKNSLREAYRLEKPLLELVGERTMDVFPWEISLAYAYDMNWKPRPVMQSYVAYSPYLDKINSDYFKMSPPERVLYGFFNLGGLYQIYYEPKTLITLMQNYSPRIRTGRYLLLERNKNRVTVYKKKLLKQVQVEWDQPVDVPEYKEGYVFAVVDIDLNAYGKIIKTVFRPSQMFIEFVVSVSEGKIRKFKYQFVRPLGTEGLLVSDNIADLGELEKLFQGKQRPEVKEVVFSPETSSHFSPDINVAFYGVPKSELVVNEEAGSEN